MSTHAQVLFDMLLYWDRIIACTYAELTDEAQKVVDALLAFADEQKEGV